MRAALCRNTTIHPPMNASSSAVAKNLLIASPPALTGLLRKIPERRAQRAGEDEGGPEEQGAGEGGSKHPHLVAAFP